MAFHLIDIENWERKEHYNHFIQDVVCGYSITANLDITKLDGYRLYPTMLWLLTDTVNSFIEFRTALTDKGLGVYDEMNPAYTIFNNEKKTFSSIWTDFNADYATFLKAYDSDVAEYASSTHYMPKPNRPDNSFDISMMPWTTFTSFNLNFFGDGKYLLPIFTMGKIFKDCGKQMIPLAIQVHHAVCDGYHVGIFIKTLQERIYLFNEEGKYS